ncbi:SGNH/GDSL hydrolase family protein [Streptomyces sp. SBT349]|uniref:SGNH/GDSL hydrolase family protein n=1 Tax=Streptomyces sp. SBT349 TaxID=1580539 RepID=UPI000AB425AA|nr:SGNH/GDSL hydrolase family protein [Streptomyces sp. SBT349]
MKPLPVTARPDLRAPRVLLVTLLAAACLLVAIPAATATPQGGPTARTGTWTGTWASPVTTVPAVDGTAFEDQTIRQIARTSIAGGAARVRLTNAFGTTPLVIGEARIARRAPGEEGPRTEPGTDRPLTFHGRSSLTIPPGGSAVSDRVSLRVPAGSDLVISLHLPEHTPGATVNSFAGQHSWVATGNATRSGDLTPTATLDRWYFLAGVDVTTPPGHRARAVVALGDSITAGTTLNANHRWTDFLTRRLADAPGPHTTAVLNQGISGNRLLHDPNPPAGSEAEGYAAYFGESGLRRFPRDVLSQPGVSDVILHLGVNDIGHPGSGVAPESERVSAADLITGYRHLITRAHERGLRVHGATITPFADTPLGFDTPDNERVRQRVNHWIRTSGAFDSVVDFDAALRDPARPERLAPRYDSGDHLHPNDAGNRAMAGAIPLHLF